MSISPSTGRPAVEADAPPPTRVGGFRPDVEGLRAVAVVLVVLYHAGVPGVRSGFVGVDVFFVISGFLITGLLLREQTTTGSLSIGSFYARRVRRILPASTLVVIVTIILAYHYLGFLSGNSVADDAKWTAFFAANLHFAAIGTSYLGSQVPPSPLQHMWSLGVEEQFYVVWPTVVLLVGRFGRRDRVRQRLAVVLGCIVVASFVLSVVQTGSDSTWAYFSPLTRAWELAAGAAVAVAAPLVTRIPRPTANLLALGGGVGVLLSAVVFSKSTAYPGSAVALPVLASVALLIGGSASASGPAQSVLGSKPFLWLGKRSYSLYLWHWPLLIIPMEYAGHNLSVADNLVWVAVALVLSTISFAVLENPVRRWRWLSRRTGVSLLVGLGLVACTFGVAELYLGLHYGSLT